MSAQTSIASSERLSAWTKIKYAFAGLGGGMTDLPMDILLLPFYTEVLGVPTAIAGWVALAAGVWDAITDPIMGTLSDATRTKVGRRRIYFLIGAVPLGFSFWWLFNPFMSNFAASFLAAFLVFRLSLTVVLIPHFALGAELSPNYDERTSIMGYNRGFWILGLLLGVFIPVALMETYTDDPQKPYAMMGLIMGIFIIFSVLVTFFGTKENPENWRETKRVSYLQGLKILFKNKPYVIVQVAYLLYHTAQAIPVTLLFYYAVHWLHISESDMLLSIPFYLVLAIISVPLWVKFTQKTNKKLAFGAALFVSTTGALLFLLVPEGGTAILFYCLMGFMGIGYGGMMTIPSSILADVVDVDELKTGERREGLYFGTWDFIRKLASNLGKWAPMMGLSLLGYIEGAESQLPTVREGIRLMFSIGPAIVFLIGVVVMWKFPMTRAEHDDIRKQLDDMRKKGE